MSYQKNRIDVISLGCSKNLIDSERLLRRLESKGYIFQHDPEKPSGEWVVVNTCGFIGDAKEESINLILELTEAKKRGEIGKIAVMGCLSQRYLDELKAEIPEVDLWYGKFNWPDFLSQLPAISQKENPNDWERNLTTPPWSAYLKIAEGCDRFCAFCAIPLITGRYHSRPKHEILDEVRTLVKNGVKEFNVIAQDLSSYGKDLNKDSSEMKSVNSGLAVLISEMSEIPGVEWIRLHYAYPGDFPMDILDVIRNKKNVCNYLDIALQHISDVVLDNMRRHISSSETISLLKTIREKVPGIRIRTTLMTGFPGEGEKEFEELLQFIEKEKFDRMGAFAYSEEDDTWAAKHFSDDIPEEVKRSRLDKIMALQESISLELNEKLIGSTIKVLIERHEGENSIGRTEYDSPEVDPEVIINNSKLPLGEFFNIRITGATPFELIGEPA